jgi:hypothetical protein
LATPLDLFVAFSWLANVVLDIGAAYYCYRLTKITGGFRAWWLIIVFTILFSVNSFSSVSYSVLSTDVMASNALNSEITGAALFNVGLGLTMSVLLFAAMFELHKTFKKVQASHPG